MLIKKNINKKEEKEEKERFILSNLISKQLDEQIRKKEEEEGFTYSNLISKQISDEISKEWDDDLYEELNEEYYREFNIQRFEYLIQISVYLDKNLKIILFIDSENLEIILIIIIWKFKNLINYYFYLYY